jgi:hypothetical protein
MDLPMCLFFENLQVLFFSYIFTLNTCYKWNVKYSLINKVFFFNFEHKFRKSNLKNMQKLDFFLIFFKDIF